VTILCEPDPAEATRLAAPLEADGAVRTVPDLAAAALFVESEPAEHVVVIGRDAPLEEIAQFTRYLLEQRPGMSVLLLRRAYDPGVVEAALAAGVREVVPADNPTALGEAYRRATAARLQVLDKTERGRPADLADELFDDAQPAPAGVMLDKAAEVVGPVEGASTHLGKVVTVFSPKGGSGKTTISTNLAVALNGAGHRVCLIDLDLEFGDVAISLRLTPVRTLVDAVTADLTETDDEIQQLLTPFRDGMDCILAPIEPGESEKIPASLVAHLLGQLRRRYDYVVVDTPSQFSEHVLVALDASDHHVLLTNPELPALKNLRLTLDMFDLLGYDRARRSIVFNRDDPAVGLTAQDVEEALKAPIAVHVPASRDVPASINRGMPIVAAKPDHPVSAAIRRFASGTLASTHLVHANRSGRRTKLFRRRS
jgi:pilus assembly protein CpaE